MSSARPPPARSPTIPKSPAWKKFVADYKAAYKDGFPSPSLFAQGYYINTKAVLLALDKVGGDLSDSEAKFRDVLGKLEFDTPTGKVKLDKNRQAIADNYLTEVAKADDGHLYNKVIKVVHGRQPDDGHPRGRLPQARLRQPRQSGLQVSLSLNARETPVMAANKAAERLSSNSVHALELEGVWRSFGALVALADINLKVGAGERRAILGSNGAGKTTLFNAVTGDFPPTSGRIKFFGEDITAFPVHERIRRGLRRTYQISQLFGGLTVLDSIFVACRGVSHRRLSLLRPSETDATMAQARSIAHNVHLDDILETPVSVLSHGQQRQLEIALALAGAPRFILFDEPAAGLSPPERRDLVAILNALPRLYRLHHHRARPRRRAASLDLRHDDAQRPHLHRRHARADRERCARSRPSISERGMARIRLRARRLEADPAGAGPAGLLRRVACAARRLADAWSAAYCRSSAATAWARRRSATRSSA